MMLRRLFPFFAIALVALAGAGAFFLNGPARIASAYVAKTLCSEVFLAGREEASVRAQDFEGVSPALKLVSARLDPEDRDVRAAMFGLGASRAVYRDGLGCTLVRGALAPVEAPAPKSESVPWAEARSGTADAIARVDYPEIDVALDGAMADATAGDRAWLVIVDGKIVAERYADGFDAETPFLSWSMAKSVTATLIGGAVLRGLVDVDAPVPVPEWAGDAGRSALTWNDLLRMQSGLAFNEDYADPSSDVNRMLFASRETGAVAAAKPLIHEPGSVWYYSSGTTNLLARSLAGVLEGAGLDAHAFPREALFDPVGASSAVFEVDSAGGFIGSSYLYMTARDWARLGALYLQDGVWNGERLLPEGWADYAARATQASNGEYGAQFWLNRDGSGRSRYLSGVPEDVYYMAGHEGQYVFIVPDRNAVIVRTGMTRGRSPIEAAGAVLEQLVAAIEPQR